MKGSKEQSFWIGFLLVTLLLVGGAIYYLVTSLGVYNNSQGDFKQKALRIRKLESAELYPNEKNLKKLTDQISAFEIEVNKVHDQLKAFQKPLPSVSDQEFPPQLRAAKEEFEAYALGKEVTTPTDFYLGMDAYQFQLPRPEATGILAFQLGAIQQVLKLVIDSGADEIYSLAREQTAVEVGQPNPELTERVVKYTFKLGFQTTHKGFQDFLNQVSNDKDYFFIVRVLRVDNEEKDGPTIDSEIVDIGDEEAAEDARVIFGDERLRITAVIDLCRFPEVPES